MKKFRVFVSILVAILLAFTSFSLFEKEPFPSAVNGYKIFEEWGALTNLSDTDEYGYDSLTTDYIETYSYALNNPESLPGYYWSTYNEWWDNDYGTNPDNVQGFLQMARIAYDIEFVAQFWTGDFTPLSTDDPWHYGVHTRDGSVSDSELFSWSGGGTGLNYFCMIWTCVNGGKEWDNNIEHQFVDAVIGDYTPYGWNDPMPTFTPSNPNTQYGGYNNGYLGVALGFTGAGVSSLEAAGKCYIGFLGHSPWLKDIHDGNSHYGVYYTDWDVGTPIASFVTSFYGHLCGYDDYGAHPSIEESLDHASWDYFGPYTEWTDTPLYTGWWEKINMDGMGGNSGWYFHRMELWGQEDLCLPRGDTEW